MNLSADTLTLVVAGLFALLLLGSVLVLVMRRSGHRLQAALEPALFRRLADAQGLHAFERRILLSLARRDGLDPSVFFVSPSSLKAALRGPGLPAGARELPRKLFGEGPAGG